MPEEVSQAIEETTMNPPAQANETVARHAAEASHWADVAAKAAHNATADTAAAAAASAASAHAAAATANNATHHGDAALKAAKTISPKVKASTVFGAFAFVFWTVAAATFWKNTFSSDTLAALTASTTTIVAAAAAYFRSDPLRSGD